MSDNRNRRAGRKTQVLGFCTLVLLSLFIVGLCTNTLVLPFVNLSAAVAKQEQNLVPALERPKDSPETPKLSFLEMLLHFGDEREEGMELSPEPYDADTLFVLADIDASALPAVREHAGETALVARLGFLVRHNADGTRSLLDENGAVLVETLDEKTDLIGQWDEKGNPVFTSEKGYVYYSKKQGKFVKSSYDPHLSAIRGVDLPIYYERPDSRIALSYKDGYYGYFYTDTGEVNYQYTHKGQSYQFREGYGALGTDEGIIVVNYVARRFFFSFGKLLPPEETGVEALGFYRMDHGLLPVIRETEDGGRETLVLTEGNQIFYLPRDFRLVCYTDGVFLLEKDGRYGYLDYTGRWIADPVYTEATPFSEGLAIVTREDGKVGVLDRSGTFVIPCEFEKITSSGGVLTLYADGRWVVLHKVK